MTKQLLAFALTVLAAGAALAQQPVRFVLPNAAGSGVDAITRAAQPAFAKAFGTALRRARH